MGKGGEFEQIAAFLRAFPLRPAPQGPGDDCAVLPAGKGELCVTTDAVVEQVHFTHAHFSPQDIGHKALAVNLSDLAAMGAEPAWFTCAIAHPKDLPDRVLRQVAVGMARLAEASGIQLVGGNFTAASELSITVTAAGRVPRGKALTRAGARPGAQLFVSGTLGDARLGLRQLQQGLSRSAPIARQRRPIPRLRLGLIARRYASAAIDVSDGLAQDLGHLCRASGVGARVRLEALPLSPAVRAALPEAQRALFAARGGEDYELLLAVPPRQVKAFVAACQRAGEDITRIGEVTPDSEVALLDAWGARVPAPSGFDHFADGAGRRRGI